jgi:2-oxoglutarate dehydrogenase E2 component (dihydrolipoamide succinyltransferase)
VSAEIVVPTLAESISDAVLVEWLKGDGEVVRVDEPVATLETDKAAVEIAATASGVLHHAHKAGDKVLVGDVLGRVDESAAAVAAAPARAAAKPAKADESPKPKLAPASASAPPAAAASSASPPPPPPPSLLSPAVRRMVEEHGLDPATIEGSGPRGRLLKEDVQRHLERGARSAPESAPAASAAAASALPGAAGTAAPAGAGERVVPMSRIRQRIAERLVRAQHTAAILTTFNEIDMTRVLELRARHKEDFEKRHGVRLGFMSFFARASVLALQEIPELNAEVRGTDIVYRDYVNLGVAVGSERGLVVPAVKHAERLDFAGLEREIARLAEKARAGTLTLDELSGGTFSISNGGVYGSLMSTPILNPPQSGILGMHKIDKRPIAVDDQVVVRPMMYVALSYDHRIVDGEQAVSFLVGVKERLEDPERMMLGV